jgi:hypothetical protein
VALPPKHAVPSAFAAVNENPSDEVPILSMLKETVISSWKRHPAE